MYYSININMAGQRPHKAACIALKGCSYIMTRTAAARRWFHKTINKAAAGILANIKVKGPKKINSQGVWDHESRPP